MHRAVNVLYWSQHNIRSEAHCWAPTHWLRMSVLRYSMSWKKMLVGVNKLIKLLWKSCVYSGFVQGTISVGIDATDLFDRYEEDFEEMPGGGFPHIEINRMHISQSVEVREACEQHVINVSIKDRSDVFFHPRPP